MHVFPDLKRLERKYARELVVIGSHSPKFSNEKDSENIRQAILRHGIEHPVVNDAEMKIFRAYGASGWPNFFLIDPLGRIVGRSGGEGKYEILDQAISELVRDFDKDLDRKERSFTLEKSKVKDGPLSYPGKILAMRDRLFISDTGHNRIVIADHSGKTLETVGGIDSGTQDGDFRTARFYQPQGLALRGSTLYVADTENHTIREVDLAAKNVRTIAGTGEQVYRRTGASKALKTPLNSPWDLALDGDRLLIAMAGNHQIWELNLARGTIGPFSGTGGEDITDGAPDTAEFAQPSGLTIAGRSLWVADSEVSAIREVDLDTGRVATIVGRGLFVFGDKDGTGEEVRLQHALGVLWHQGKLYVADSYNHKIKVCDPDKRIVRTLFGKGKQDPFYEPSGLAAWGDTLFVADQNNHAIRACDLKMGEVRTLKIAP